MTATKPILEALPDERRAAVESWLVEFDRGWDEGRLAAQVGRLPPTLHSLRLPILVEMVKIDLERHWQNGQPVEVERYLHRYPELGTADTVSLDLLAAEYEVRQHFGGDP